MVLHSSLTLFSSEVTTEPWDAFDAVSLSVKFEIPITPFVSSVIGSLEWFAVWESLGMLPPAGAGWLGAEPEPPMPGRTPAVGLLLPPSTGRGCFIISAAHIVLVILRSDDRLDRHGHLNLSAVLRKGFVKGNSQLRLFLVLVARLSFGDLSHHQGIFREDDLTAVVL